MTQYQIRNMRTWSDKHNPRKVALSAIKRGTRFVRGLFTPWAIAFLLLCAALGYASLGLWR